MGLLEQNGEATPVNVQANLGADNTLVAAPTDGTRIKLVSGFLYNDTAADSIFSLKSGATVIFGPITIPAKGQINLTGMAGDYALVCNANQALILNCSTVNAGRGLLQVQQY